MIHEYSLFVVHHVHQEGASWPRRLKMFIFPRIHMMSCTLTATWTNKMYDKLNKVILFLLSCCVVISSLWFFWRFPFQMLINGLLQYANNTEWKPAPALQYLAPKWNSRTFGHNVYSTVASQFLTSLLTAQYWHNYSGNISGCIMKVKTLTHIYIFFYTLFVIAIVSINSA